MKGEVDESVEKNVFLNYTEINGGDRRSNTSSSYFCGRWMHMSSWLGAAVIIIITWSFFASECYQLYSAINNGTCQRWYYQIHDAAETVYLLVVFLAIVIQLVVIARNNNWFEDTKFDNYPMLIAMVICAFVDVGYYSIHFVTIFVNHHFVSQLCSTFSEFLFGGAIIPLIVVHMCYYLGREHRRMRVFISITILLSIGGCLIIFVRRVAMKIRTDFNVTCFDVIDEYRFVYNKAIRAKRVLVLVDITYFLIGLLFLIYLLMKLRNDAPQSVQMNDDRTTVDRNFLSGIALVRYRWLTLTISIILIVVYLSGSYIINEILDVNMVVGQTIFLLYTMALYVVAIFYFVVYYLTDHSSQPVVTKAYSQNDGFFSKVTSTVQILYGCCMFAFYIWVYHGVLTQNLHRIKVIIYLFLVAQAATQLWYIDSVTKRNFIHNTSYIKSLLFPPIVLALINFGFLLQNIFYMPNGLSGSGDNITQNIVFVILTDLLAPIAMLNRLHGMAFFIKLSIQQWYL